MVRVAGGEVGSFVVWIWKNPVATIQHHVFKQQQLEGKHENILVDNDKQSQGSETSGGGTNVGRSDEEGRSEWYLDHVVNLTRFCIYNFMYV
jgi:hypothetical protein